MVVLTTGPNELPNDFDTFFDLKTMKELKKELLRLQDKQYSLNRLMKMYNINVKLRKPKITIFG